MINFIDIIIKLYSSSTATIFDFTGNTTTI